MYRDIIPIAMLNVLQKLPKNPNSDHFAFEIGYEKGNKNATLKNYLDRILLMSIEENNEEEKKKGHDL